MLKAIRIYIGECLSRALRGSLASALNWSGIVGAGLLGATLQFRGSTMTFGDGWQGVVLSGIAYTAVAWVAIFVVRLVFVAPFQMWREQKDRTDALDGLRDAAKQVARSPSFDVGFEYAAFDPEKKIIGGHHIHHSSLRIWVQNIEGRAIEDCRVVIESFGPDSPIRSGAMLLADNRGSDEEKSARFDLAGTEKRFFKFIELSVFPGREPNNRLEKYGYTEPGHPTTYSFELRSDQEGRGWARFFNGYHLDAGKRYFATIVVHGKNASSRRMDMTIDVIDNGELRVDEAASTDPHPREVVETESPLPEAASGPSGR